jgi:hypothetical protein
MEHGMYNAYDVAKHAKKIGDSIEQRCSGIRDGNTCVLK